MKAKIYFLIPAILILLACTDIYAQHGWVKQQINTQADIKKIVAIDSLNYIAIPDTIGIFRTTDGGASWSRQIFFEFNSFTTGEFPNSQTGYLISGNQMRKTTNGGANWFAITLHNYSYFSVDFINANTGYIAGTDPSFDSPTAIVSKTTNGGNNWVSFFVDLTFCYQVKAYSADSAHAWVVNRLYYTTNGGANWTRHTLSSGGVGGSASLDFNTGITAGSAGFLYKTTNKGLNWNSLEYGVNQIARSIIFFNSSTGYLAGNGGLISRTTNSGENWTTQNSGVSSNLNDIMFINELTGFASGVAGVILKTTTAGLTFIKTISENIPDKFQLHQNYPNPFNPETNIKFDLPEASNVKITIYNSLGKQMQVLADEHKQAGSYEVKFNGEGYSGGIYFYRITAGELTETRKMLLVK
jgi:photosystem II stability/assembly factor-like uncharacterized protein